MQVCLQDSSACWCRLASGCTLTGETGGWVGEAEEWLVLVMQRWIESKSKGAMRWTKGPRATAQSARGQRDQQTLAGLACGIAVRTFAAVAAGIVTANFAPVLADMHARLVEHLLAQVQPAWVLVAGCSDGSSMRTLASACSYW